MQIVTYDQAVKYLENFIGKVIFKVDPQSVRRQHPLERMRILLNLLDYPQNKFQSVLVGGTSGKGSTAYLISHILKTAGYKTGLTISPHLQKVNERLQINNKSISDEAFVKLLNTLILPSIRVMSKMKIGSPSYFEILVAMAFLYFAKEKVDIAVVEVGMGGEFDATNTLFPCVSVLTNVSLDHTNVLGKTIEEIANTKVGIIKSGSLPLVVVTGVKQPTVIKIVENKCREVGAKLYRLEKDFNFRIKKERKKGSIFDLTITNGRELKLNDLKLSLLGEYQVENASLAIKTILELEKFACLPTGMGFKFSEEYVRKALSTAFFPGRFEIARINSSPHPLNDSSRPNGNTREAYEKVPVIPAAMISINENKETVKRSFRGKVRSQLDTKRHTLILDGAHNPTKMRAFLTTLKKLFPKEKKIFIVAFKNDKDIKGMLKEIAKAADYVVGTEFHIKTDTAVSASLDSKSIKSQLLSIKFRGKIFVESDSKKALNRSLKLSTLNQYNNTAIIIVTGSLYLVGEIRSML